MHIIFLRVVGKVINDQIATIYDTHQTQIFSKSSKVTLQHKFKTDVTLHLRFLVFTAAFLIIPVHFLANFRRSSFLRHSVFLRFVFVVFLIFN
jgi:hypothetical protein